MKTHQMGLFDESTRLEKLSKIGDPLELLDKVIDWEMFRDTITKRCRKDSYDKGGRPPYDVVMMFKVLVIQRLYNLSDDQTEYQINDRLSFMRFLGISMSDKVPDAKTIWKFKNDMARSETVDYLFGVFYDKLEAEGYVTHSGTIIDATFVDAPRQRNSRGENSEIKDGGIPEEWKGNAHKLAQKDVDARWAKKNGEVHYGYKDHVKCDADSKLIIDYDVTDASVHDSRVCVEFVDETDVAVYADSAYSGSPISEALPEGCENRICEKGYREHPLTEEQKKSNAEKSKVRCRIEHVFGFMTNSMNGILLRSIGIMRACFNIGITNLVYNLCRYRFLKLAR